MELDVGVPKREMTSNNTRTSAHPYTAPNAHAAAAEIKNSTGDALGGTDSGVDALRKAMQAAQEGRPSAIAQLMSDHQDAYQIPPEFLQQQQAIAEQRGLHESMRSGVYDKSHSNKETSLFDANQLRDEQRIEELTNHFAGTSGSEHPAEMSQLGDAIAAAKNGDPAAMANFLENGQPSKEHLGNIRQQAERSKMVDGANGFYDQPSSEQLQQIEQQKIIELTEALKSQAVQVDADPEIQITLSSNVTREVKSGTYWNIFLLAHIKPLIDLLRLNPQDSSAFLHIARKSRGPIMPGTKAAKDKPTQWHYESSAHMGA